MAGRETFPKSVKKEVVDNNELLFRRIRAQALYGDYEIRNGRVFLTDKAFDDRKKEPSVDRAKLCVGGAKDAQNRLKREGGEKNGVAVLRASEVREISKKMENRCVVDVRPDPTEANVTHAVIYGIPPFTDFEFDRLKARLRLLANARPLAIQPNAAEL